MNDVMSFEQFEKIYDTARKLLRITTDLFNLNDDMKQVSDIIYVEIMRLHNVAVDFIEAYHNLKNKEDK